MCSRRIDDLNLNGKKIIQDTDYFCFGIDSVLLANFAYSKSSKNIVVDLCSGSGVIPVIFSQKQKCDKIYAIELQDKMYDLLKENISMNDLEQKIIPVHSDIKKFNIDKKVDVVICNPPYKAVGTGTINENSIKYIARHEAKCTLEDIFLCASRILKEKGKLYIVHKPERLVDLFCIARKYHLEPKTLRLMYPYVNSSPSVVLIEYVYGGGNELKVLKPLVEYDETGEYTKEITDLYE